MVNCTLFRCGKHLKRVIIADDKYRQKLVQLLMKTIMYGWSYVVKKLGNEITTNARAENVVEIVAIKRNTIMYGSIFCREITSI